MAVLFMVDERLDKQKLELSEFARNLTGVQGELLNGLKQEINVEVQQIKNEQTNAKIDVEHCKRALKKMSEDTAAKVKTQK